MFCHCLAFGVIMIVPRLNISKHRCDQPNFSIFQCRAEEDIAPGLRVWRRALSEARSAAQVALCIQQLQKSIAWEKSIMKVVSVFHLKKKKKYCN